ncbi:hypothetical protein C8J57DRAFT_5162 [Mycena rebaudengoi]|nr:hypothetical protein C8J57DRAFT_5162 [Mycena rebaudengoi]
MDQCTSLDSLAAFTKQFFEDNGFLPGLKTLSRTLENSRAYVIQRFGLEDSSLWHLIERCARIASALFGAPILVTLIDVDTQLVLAAVDRPYKPKDVLIYNESLCSHTALRTDGSVLEILDTQKDWRFKNIPNAPRAYLGQPLMLPLHDGGPSVPFGSLCILGDTPRIPMTSEERGALSDLADLLSADIQRAWQENRQ